MKDKKGSEYILPDISSYIDNRKLEEAIINSHDDNFITLLDNNKYINFSLKNNPNIIIFGKEDYGKSSFVKNIIYNILLTKRPDECQIAIIDTYDFVYKAYEDIPHLYYPIATECKNGMLVLDLINIEVNKRLDIFLKNNVKDIYAYNKDNHNMPYIYLFIDRLDTLLKYNKDKTINLLNSITEKARLTGIFVIAVTENIDKKVLPSKLNTAFSTKISFRANTPHESIVMLNSIGSEELDRGELYINTPQNKHDGLYQFKKINKKDNYSLIAYVNNQKKDLENKYYQEDNYVDNFEDNNKFKLIEHNLMKEILSLLMILIALIFLIIYVLER